MAFGKNQPNLLFSWRETCGRVLMAWIRVRHLQTATFSVFVILLCILLKNNHLTFLVQFGNNLHSVVFQKVQIAFALRAHAIEKSSDANYFQLNTKSNDSLLKTDELISEAAHILVKLPVMQSFLGLCLDVMTFSEECTCLIWITGLWGS